MNLLISATSYLPEAEESPEEEDDQQNSLCCYQSSRNTETIISSAKGVKYIL